MRGEGREGDQVGGEGRRGDQVGGEVRGKKVR